MNKPLDNGAKVKYKTEDGKEGTGVVHGVTTQENAEGIITSISYQIDTGKTVRTDVQVRSKRDEAITTRVDEMVAKGMDFLKASLKAETIEGLPGEDELYEVKTRHPELVVVPGDFVKPA